MEKENKPPKTYIPRKNSNSIDFYPTPKWMTDAILSKGVLDDCNSIWEPFCGKEHMVRAIKDWYKNKKYIMASDIIDYEPKKYCNCFFVSDFNLSDKINPYFYENRLIKIDAIMSNPPYKNSSSYLLKAASFNPKKILFLMPINYLGGAARAIHFDICNLTNVYVFSNRSNMNKNQVDKAPRGMTNYAWYLFEPNKKKEETKIIFLNERSKPDPENWP